VLERFPGDKRRLRGEFVFFFFFFVKKKPKFFRYRIPFGLASVPVSAVSDEHNSHFQNQLPIFLVQEKGEFILFFFCLFALSEKN
jgi:hypothetical protein